MEPGLQNTFNRIRIKVCFAYGSNIDLVIQILKESSWEHVEVSATKYIGYFVIPILK
jgi:small-conductance mechanosensitive channel